MWKECAGKEVEFVRGAKVPIVTFVEERSKLAIDINCNAPDGLATSAAARAALESAPEMRPLVLALKIALQQGGLNKPRWGGVGSFLLLAMVSAALIRMRREGWTTNDLGELLIGIALTTTNVYY